MLLNILWCTEQSPQWRIIWHLNANSEIEKLGSRGFVAMMVITLLTFLFIYLFIYLAQPWDVPRLGIKPTAQLSLEAQQ